jgi:pimeloyl-ACP methyl ester carboxylesterase
LAGAIALLSLSACGDADEKGSSCDGPESVAGLTLDDVLAPGPHPVGRREITLVRDGLCFEGSANTPCERSLRTHVHYPATERGDDVPVASGGPFPLVVYNHGFMSSLVENTTLLRILASRGYVAVAASFPNTSLGSDVNLLDVINQPADVSFLIDWALDLVEGEPSPLPGAIDDTRIAVGGLSLGGMTTLLATYHGALRDERVVAAFAIAPPTAIFTSAFYETTSVPFLLIAGSEDAVVPYAQNGAGGFEQMLPPAEMITLEAGSHLGFAEQGLLFSSYEHPDELACSTLDGAVPDDDTGGWAELDGLGGDEHGVDLEAEFGTLCGDDELPPAMRPRRQLDLTTASVVSFLEGRVGGDAAYAQFLAEGVPGDGCDAVYASR